MWSSVLLFLLSPLLKWLTTSVIVGGLGIAIYLFTPVWFPGRFRNIAGIVGVCALTGGAFYWYAFHAGERHMAQRIAARDAAAISRVDDITKDVESCNGGVDWDVTTGTCTR